MTKYRSSHGLTTCPTCQRHIEAGQLASKTVCPFCARARPMSLRGGVLAASLFALTACGTAETTPVAEDSSDTQGGETTGTVPSDDLVAVPVYGIAVPPEQVPDSGEEEESDDSSEDPQAEGEGFEPAPDMQPMARYGMAPVR